MEKRKTIIASIFTLSICILFAMKMKYEQTGNAFVPETVLAAGIIFLMAAIIGPVGRLIFKKADSFSHAKVVKWIIPTLLGFYLFTFIAAYFSVSFGVFIWYLIKGYSLSEYIPNLTNEFTGIEKGNILGWLLFFTVIMFYVLWQKSIKKEQKLREENLKFKYQNLKSQVNPHFLFNSLNTLSEIVYEDAKTADKYIQKLSAIYRYILENEEIDLVPLNKEIEFVKQYLDIQKVRDNDKILLEIDFQDADDFKVVPVSLQILVENALKHNSRSEKLPLKIRIERSNDRIVVSNNIQRKNILESKSKTGLLNLKERVKLILDKDLIYEEDNNQFIVKLPIIKLQR